MSKSKQFKLGRVSAPCSMRARARLESTVSLNRGSGVRPDENAEIQLPKVGHRRKDSCRGIKPNFQCQNVSKCMALVGSRL